LEEPFNKYAAFPLDAIHMVIAGLALQLNDWQRLRASANSGRMSTIKSWDCSIFFFRSYIAVATLAAMASVSTV